MVSATGGEPRKKTILTLFGTRPEIIKLAPVIRAFEAHGEHFRSLCVSSSQHTDLLQPLIQKFDLKLDHDLKVMQPNQTLSSLASRVLTALDPILVEEKPDMVLVQGDTTTALAGALAAFHRQIPVGHVEAGLRSGDKNSPFPEEMNRRLITKIAACHFAATTANAAILEKEGVNKDEIFITGNPVVDALHAMLEKAVPTGATADILNATKGCRRILLTTHRRESFGDRMFENLCVLKDFVAKNADIALIFPVHPNPSVRKPAQELLGNCERIHLAPPMEYDQFVSLMSHTWLIVSDSGGVQEEAPSLGKPLLILRENTERPEAVDSGCAKLVGSPKRLAMLLEDALAKDSWIHGVASVANPFGDGDASEKIVAATAKVLGITLSNPEVVLS